MSSLPKAQAIKNTDGSYSVRVFYLPERFTEVVFPHDSQNEQLALEYADFKNQQRVSGPNSPATQAVLTEYRAMQAGDEHEKLVEKALPKLTKVGPAPVAAAAPVEVPATAPTLSQELQAELEPLPASKVNASQEFPVDATVPVPPPTSPAPVQSQGEAPAPAAPTATAATEESAS